MHAALHLPRTFELTAHNILCKLRAFVIERCFELSGAFSFFSAFGPSLVALLCSATGALRLHAWRFAPRFVSDVTEGWTHTIKTVLKRQVRLGSSLGFQTRWTDYSQSSLETSTPCTTSLVLSASKVNRMISLQWMSEKSVLSEVSGACLY